MIINAENNSYNVHDRYKNFVCEYIYIVILFLYIHVYIRKRAKRSFREVSLERRLAIR